MQSSKKSKYNFSLILLFQLVASMSWMISVFIYGSFSLGDLFQSMLKRESNIKDSGNILPGHGGVLDRFDSILLCFPTFYLYLNYINPILNY